MSVRPFQCEFYTIILYLLHNFFDLLDPFVSQIVKDICVFFSVSAKVAKFFVLSDWFVFVIVLTWY